ncbi:hydroxymethylbilane synthase [Candidatus Neptunochlamydia vexilliferae]|uniref:Hydroxymethylbilane synthase n=1 Tax=Candidatus Neptunichlamydia vexilliferae TaxID=1651774 RepID=A0ABS0AYY1_9BACT|nr:hydroxymethylbilane synthase [Candidatus Neptunochlamydia vexilliferae]MBF5059329.1 Hydroxymethylbilane synthase [Candidatus Neptunochlamydia vexilliferae]
MVIKIGARGSLLSRRQVKEVMGEIPHFCEWVETVGDRDLESSLGPMEKTDFFTREIDQRVLDGRCDVGIHSAKDLPDPLPEGLEMVALTEGVDPSDSLVMREGDRLETLPVGAVIGSSSERRDRVVKGLRPDLKCIEVRGPVDKRLEMLDRGEIDGLVVAEAALIRLGIERNRISLPGKTAPLQGKLAILARNGDKEMEAFFKKFDSRKKDRVLHVGLSAPKKGTHLPLIEIVPRDFESFEIKKAFADMEEYTHLIFTSQKGVEVFFQCMGHYGLKLGQKKIFAVGRKTAVALREKGLRDLEVAVEETQEGIIHLLALEDLGRAYVLLPQSALARPALAATLRIRRIRHQVCPLYDTRTRWPEVKPDLKNFDEVFFTSPSTVRAFQEVFGKVPKGMKVSAIGPITEQSLKLHL